MFVIDLMFINFLILLTDLWEFERYTYFMKHHIKFFYYLRVWTTEIIQKHFIFQWFKKIDWLTIVLVSWINAELFRINAILTSFFLLFCVILPHGLQEFYLVDDKDFTSWMISMLLMDDKDFNSWMIFFEWFYLMYDKDFSSWMTSI